MEGQLYQWLKGEYAGDYDKAIDVKKEDDIIFIVFENGRKCNAELADEFLYPVDSENEGFNISIEEIEDTIEKKAKDGTVYKIPGPDHGKTRIKKVPKNPKKVTPAPTISNKIKPVVPDNGPGNSDPVIQLLEKAKKTKKKFTFEIEIDTIKESTYEVLIENFEESEETILNYIYSSIPLDVLENVIKEKIKDIYQPQVIDE